MKYVPLVMASLLLSGCLQVHKRTMPFCAPQLAIETFRRNLFGVDTDYLTDHRNFRLEVGTCDAEHEDFVYTCQGDTIQVFKLNHSSKNCHVVILADGRKSVQCDVDTVEHKLYSLLALRKNGVFD